MTIQESRSSVASTRVVHHRRGSLKAGMNRRGSMGRRNSLTNNSNCGGGGCAGRRASMSSTTSMSSRRGSAGSMAAASGSPLDLSSSMILPNDMDMEIHCEHNHSSNGTKTPKKRTASIGYALSSGNHEESIMVDWIVTTLGQHLKQIVARNLENTSAIENARFYKAREAALRFPAPLEQVQQAPELNVQTDDNANENNVAASVVFEQDTSWVELPEEVWDQLRHYVTKIATHYQSKNPFHNFAHACNVTLSMSKFLQRMSVERGLSLSNMEHDHTYGITSDPLTSFACVLAALVHDVDHPGVSNAQLAKDDPQLAARYQHRSIAEQHSITVAWELLMDSQAYPDLRATLSNHNTDDLVRLHSLLVNIVMATDIFDQEFKKHREARWQQVVQEQERPSNDNDDENTNKNTMVSYLAPEAPTSLKATICIEHLMQASDISHTMQHWHVYRSWNERLFAEMYLAYRQGRSDKDPSTFWYKGEIGFFDFYVIPFAKKLQTCGVFGSASDECLHFATENRRRWVEEGEAAVQEMINRVILQVLDKTAQEMDDLDIDAVEMPPSA